MDDEHRLREVDARLRDALRPDDEAARRILARALAAAAHGAARTGDGSMRVAYTRDEHKERGNAVVIGVPSRHARSRPAWAIPVIALMVGVAAAGLWQSRRLPPPHPSAPLAVTGAGSVVVVEHPDGRRWIVGPAPEPRNGGNYVIVLEK